MADLYRKSSLEQLSSPDKLDCMLLVVSPLTKIVVIVSALLCIAVVIWSIIGTIPTVVTANGVVSMNGGVGTVFSDRGGKITNINIKKGNIISKGSILAEIEDSFGQKHYVTSAYNGRVTSILVERGMMITPFTDLIRVQPKTDTSLIAVCYVPITYAGQIQEGMDATIFRTAASSAEGISATVIGVDNSASTQSSMLDVLGADGQMASAFASEGPVVAVICELKDQNADLHVGEVLNVRIIADKSAPITKVFPFLK